MSISTEKISENIRKRFQTGTGVYHNSKKRLTIISLFYLLLYLISTRSLTYTRDSTGVKFGSIANLFEGSGFIRDTPIVKIVIEPIALFVSPVSIVTGTLLGLLVGFNLILLHIVIRQPERCKISDTTGVLTSAPALLSGTACCGPIVPIILGIQVTSTLTSLLNIVIPVAFIVLLITIYALLGRVENVPKKT